MANTSGNSSDGVKFRLRNDLQFADYAVGLERQFVVKDPLKLEYYLFEPFEKSLLDFLNTPMTAESLKSAANRAMKPAVVESAEIKRFIQRLLNDNLVVTDCTGVGSAMRQSAARQKTNQRLQSVFGILAIRFRGMNPQSMLDAVNPLTKWLFHPAWIVLAMVCFVVALVAAAVNLSRIFETDFLWQNLRDPRTFIAIGLALMVVKVLHELGHAFACRSIGRDCHELGVMLLAFVPCLYCNVSDVWMEPNRWKRIMVSAAGIYVEICIAAVCVPLWLFSQPGPMQVFWFAMLTICSVNTLLVNGNPLLRYDGYYVLSDLVGVPNLYNVSQESFRNRIRKFFFRDVQGSQPTSWLEWYGLCCRLYRFVVLGVIVYAIYSFFERIELPSLGTLIAILLAFMTFGFSTFLAVRKILRGHWIQDLKMRRSIAVAACLVCVVVLAAFIPVATKIYADGETALKGNCLVFAPDGGAVSWSVEPGETVEAGACLAKIESDFLELKLLEKRQRVAELELSLSNQVLLQNQGVENSHEIELQKNALSNAAKIVGQLEGRKNELSILAPIDGRLLPLPQKELDVHKRNPLDLKRLSSTLLVENQAAVVRSGEPIAIVVNDESELVRLNVAEKQIDRVAVGQTVRLIIDQYSPDVITGVVTEIAIDNLYATNRVDSQQQSPVENGEVVVVVEFTTANVDAFYRSKVKAAIVGAKVPIYQHVKRFVSDNFAF